MFELSVACKYLIPRRRQLSVSIISLISICVIALVVWLIVVFFSVTNGLEKNWIQKLTTLTAPVRITPTEAYHNSYYYQIDKVSDKSGYSIKTIREKLESPNTDPYNPSYDQDLPPTFPQPDLNAEGDLKDLVKLAYASLEEIKDVPGIIGKDFELTSTQIHLDLVRNTSIVHDHNIFGSVVRSVLTYPAYLGNFEEDNLNFSRTLLPIEDHDFNNILSLIGKTNFEENEKQTFDEEEFLQGIKDYFQSIEVNQLKTRATGWIIPERILPNYAIWKAAFISNGKKIVRIIVPQQENQLVDIYRSLEEQGLKVSLGTVLVNSGQITVQQSDHPDLQMPPKFGLTLAAGSTFNASIDHASLNDVKKPDDIRFQVDMAIQGISLKGIVNFRGLEIASAKKINEDNSESRFWVYETLTSENNPSFHLPGNDNIGEGIILPKSFRDAGVMLGDRGSLSYISPTTSVIEEQLIPIFVAGFYDPGIIPIGGKFILANREVTSLIRDAHQTEEGSNLSNGINVRFDNIDDAEKVKGQLQLAFKKKGISKYWNIESFREYEFTKEILQELQSQKNLFMLIAVVIILVACSNIISMLIILVNDKKLEIGILRSMGATSKHIATIFGFAGAIIGILGSAIGISLAIFTLHFLDNLIYLLSLLQGHEMFSASFYGKVLPSELSWEALSFVLFATLCISLLAGIVPAVKACLLRPSQILRSGG